MIKKLANPEVLEAAANQYDVYRDAIDFKEWMEGDNIALIDDDGNIGLFEKNYPGVFTAHYLFLPSCRGRKAINLSIQMLREIFTNHGAKTIRGVTPLSNMAARWITRQLGFTSHGVCTFLQGPCELFTLTIDEFFHKHRIT